MKNSTFLLFLLFLAACSPKTAEVVVAYEMESRAKSDYHQLEKGAVLNNWLTKRVTFVAQSCAFESQHLLKVSLDGNEPYICLDSDFREMLAYHSPNLSVKVIEEGRFRVFGTLQSISTDRGKGGQPHTEYYLDLEAIEKE